MIGGAGWLSDGARPIFQTARHLERIDKVRAAFSPFAKQPFRPRARLASRRILWQSEGGVGGAPPAAILLFVQPPSAVTLAPIVRRHPRVPLARLIANNRLTSKSGLILKDNWKGIVPTAFMRKNKGAGATEGEETVDGQEGKTSHW